MRQRGRLLTALLVVGAAAGLLLAERRYPLRARREPWSRHSARNAAVAVGAAVAIQAALQPASDQFLVLAERRRLGILRRLALPRPVEAALAVVLLDYSFYLWHVMLHRLPVLWRFHAVHHADLDLDASTALRFHFGEMILSIPWRGAQILLLGPSAPVMRLWQGLTLLSVAFHHSNLRLPAGLDRSIAYIVTTPRLHGIHHSKIASEQASNLSSGLTLWDRLHGSLRDDVPQKTIDIGLPHPHRPETVALLPMLRLPFTRGAGHLPPRG